MKELEMKGKFTSKLKRVVDSIPDDLKLLLLNRKINILVVGASGVGKSSTINALFNKKEANVVNGFGTGTFDIKKYEIGNLTIWDSPGLGDSPKNEYEFRNMIRSKVIEKNEKGEPLIDLILVLLDANSRDFGTTFGLINFIKEGLDREEKIRLLIAVNKMDKMYDGNYWNKIEGIPKEGLDEKLEEETRKLKQKIKEGTELDLEPIYYVAGYSDEEINSKSYNLDKLMYHILKNIPRNKVYSVVKEMNKDESKWEKSDNKSDYKKGIWDLLWDGVKSTVGSVKDFILDKGIDILDSIIKSKTGKSKEELMEEWMDFLFKSTEEDKSKK